MSKNPLYQDKISSTTTTTNHSRQLIEFDTAQFIQCFESIRKMHNTLHFSIFAFLSADITIISFAIESNTPILICVGAILPFLIHLYWIRVRKMSFPAFISAISIERKYAESPVLNYLSSTFLAITYDYSEYKLIMDITSSNKTSEEDKIKEIRKLKLDKNFGKQSKFIYILILISIIQFLFGVIYYLYQNKII